MSDKTEAQATELTVNFIPEARFRPRITHNFKEVLEGLVKNPGKIAEIKAVTLDDAKELQRGFHSSGTGRRFKREGYMIETTREEFTVQVKLTKIPVRKRGRPQKQRAAG